MRIRIIAIVIVGLISGTAGWTLRADESASVNKAASVNESQTVGDESPGSAAETGLDSDAETGVATDKMRQMQEDAITGLQADWGYWGSSPDRYSTWMNHSNRLIPIYTFGLTLDELRRQGSVYSDEARLKELYGIVPEGTLIKDAPYFDQTDVYRLQQQALEQGKTQIILIVFDGMDWESTYNAALYKNGAVTYTEGRGNGLTLQDYRGTDTDFGYFVTSPRLAGGRLDVDAQTILNGDNPPTGGYDPTRGGFAPWETAPQKDYLMGLDRTQPHAVTDSASSGTSMTAGIKTYNAAINVDVFGKQVETIAHQLQRDRRFAIGVVTSVPISHATPGTAYAHNVSRDDYQDITRDLIGLPSVAHKREPLPGVDVLIGGGWGKSTKQDAKQGSNFVPGREYYDPEDLSRVSLQADGKYVVAQRTPGQKGSEVLEEAAKTAIQGGHRLLAVFGGPDGHLPFSTANGDFNPTLDARGQAVYSPADVTENPVLAEMSVAALQVLQKNEHGFWLMIEAGDVDWANHANSIDNSIGAVLSGDAAVSAVFDWVEKESDWSKTAVIVTADHGHYFMLTDPQAIADAGAAASQK